MNKVSVITLILLLFLALYIRIVHARIAPEIITKNGVENCVVREIRFSNAYSYIRTFGECKIIYDMCTHNKKCIITDIDEQREYGSTKLK